MSTQAVESFYNKVLRDPGLQERFKAASGEEAFVQLAVNLGAQNGFSFTPDEVRERLKQVAGDNEAELTDRQLETVAGGSVSWGSSILCGYCGSKSATASIPV